MKANHNIKGSGIDSAGRPRLTFQPLRWSMVLDRNYQRYLELVKQPLSIKVSVILTATDIASLDLTLPIYLKQYGCYCAILKATTKNDNVVDLELLRM